jgi:hypothetical protein
MFSLFAQSLFLYHTHVIVVLQHGSIICSLTPGYLDGAAARRAFLC